MIRKKVKDQVYVVIVISAKTGNVFNIRITPSRIDKTVSEIVGGNKRIVTAKDLLHQHLCAISFSVNVENAKNDTASRLAGFDIYGDAVVTKLNVFGESNAVSLKTAEEITKGICYGI